MCSTSAASFTFMTNLTTSGMLYCRGSSYSDVVHNSSFNKLNLFLVSGNFSSRFLFSVFLYVYLLVLYDPPVLFFSFILSWSWRIGSESGVSPTWSLLLALVPVPTCLLFMFSLPLCPYLASSPLSFLTTAAYVFLFCSLKYPLFLKKGIFAINNGVKKYTSKSQW